MYSSCKLRKNRVQGLLLSRYTHTFKQRASFLQCSPEKGPFSSSTFGCKDFTCGECGAFVEFGPSAYALVAVYIAWKQTWKTTGGVIVPCFHVGMHLRVRQVSEHWATEILRANEEFKGFTPLAAGFALWYSWHESFPEPTRKIGKMWRCAIMYHQPPKKYETWKTIGNVPPTSQEVRHLESDRGRLNFPTAYRLYNK